MSIARESSGKSSRSRHPRIASCGVFLLAVFALSGCQAPATTNISGPKSEIERHDIPTPGIKSTTDEIEIDVAPAPACPEGPHSDMGLFRPMTCGAPVEHPTYHASAQLPEETDGSDTLVPGETKAIPGAGSKSDGVPFHVGPNMTGHYRRKTTTTETDPAMRTDQAAKGAGASLDTSSDKAADAFKSEAPATAVTPPNDPKGANSTGGGAEITSTVTNLAKGSFNIFTIIGALFGLGAVGCFIAGIYGAPTQKLVLPLIIAAGAFIVAGVVVSTYPWVALVLVIGAAAAGVGYLIYKHVKAEKGAAATTAGTILANAVADHPAGAAIIGNATSATASHPDSVVSALEDLLPSVLQPKPAPVAQPVAATLQQTAAPLAPIIQAPAAPAPSPTHTVSTTNSVTTTVTPITPAPATP